MKLFYKYPRISGHLLVAILYYGIVNLMIVHFIVDSERLALIPALNKVGIFVVIIMGSFIGQMTKEQANIRGIK